MVKPLRFRRHIILAAFLFYGWHFETPALHGEDSTTLGPVEGSITIEWENLESSYRVQVRRGGQVFIDTTITENHLNLGLAPGEYQYKVSVLNPFGKTVSESDWLPLGVQKSRIPYFRIRPPVIAWEGDVGVSLNLESAYIREQTVFQLQNGDASISLDWTGAAGVYNAVVPDDTAGPGSWNLTAIDPSGHSFTFPGALVVRPTRSPEVNRPTEPATLPASGITPITIEGTAFDTDMKVSFQGPGGGIPVTALEITDGRSAIAYLNLEGAATGSYDLVAVNPAGDETTIEDFLTITEPVKVEVYRRQPRIGFQMGWAPMWIDIPGSDAHLPSYLAFDIAGLFQSGLKTPFFRGLGLETRLMFGISGPANVPDSSVDFISSLDVSGYYRPLVKGKVAPVFLLGVGNLRSGYAGKYGIENILFIRTGIGMDVTRGHDDFRLGVNFGWGFAGDTLPMISLMFRRGMSY